MDYKFLFIITSALHPFEKGSFHNLSEDRFNQTLKTIETVREKVPNSTILLVESSEFKLEEQYRKILIKNSDIFLECYEDETLKRTYENLHSNPSQFNFGKSILESIGMRNAFEKIINDRLFLSHHRIFKLTGRYYLNEDFDINDYCSRCLVNYYVFNVCKFNDKNLEYFKDLMGIDGQLTTGLWSFCSTLIYQTYETYQKSIQYMDWVLSTGNSIDIERCLYKFIDERNIVNMKVLGATQIHGPTGEIHNL